MPDRKTAFSVVVLACATFLVFSGALEHSFVNYDDLLHVKLNPLVQRLTPGNVARMFAGPHLKHYQPIAFLSFAVEHAFFGMKPGVFHTTNVLLHVLNTALVFLMVLRLGESRLSAFVCALLFGIHPTHVESVAWITERRDVLSTLFFLLSILAYLSWNRKGSGKGHLLALLFFTGSLMVKPMAVTLPVVLVLVDLFQGRTMDGRRICRLVPFFCLSVLFGLVAVWSQQRTGVPIEAGAPGQPVRFLIAPMSVMFYLFKLVFPLNLSAVYPMPGKEMIRMLGVPAVLALSLLAAELFMLRRRHATLFFSFAFFLVTIAPVSQLIPFAWYGFAADRFLYVPSMGLFFGLGSLVDGAFRRSCRFLKLKNALLTLFLLVTAVYLGFLTINRVRVWENGGTLWTDACRKNPESFTAHHGLCTWYLSEGRHEEALEEIEVMAEINPGDPQLFSLTGELNHDLANLDEAIKNYRISLGMDPDNAMVLNNLGVVYLEKGDFELALRMFLKALDLNPYLHMIHYNLGRAYGGLGETYKAVAEYSKVLKRFPRYADGWNNLGIEYVKQGKVQSGIEAFETALFHDPSHSAASVNRDRLLQGKKGSGGSAAR